MALQVAVPFSGGTTSIIKIIGQVFDALAHLISRSHAYLGNLAAP